MKKNVSLSLYKTLLYSDFNLLKFIEKDSFIPFSGYISLRLHKKFTYLNLFETIKSLKQLIRLIQFIKVKAQHRITLKMLNKYFYVLMKEFCLIYKFKTKRVIIEHSSILIKSRVKNLTEFFLFLGKFFTSFTRHLFKQNVRLIFNMNLSLNRKNCGVYKLYNEVVDFQKILFFMVLLKKVYK